MSSLGHANLTSNPLAHLSGNPWYANQVAAAVGYFISKAWEEAQELRGSVERDITQVQEALPDLLKLPDFFADLSGISYTHADPAVSMTRGDYSGLQPTVPTLPERGGLLSEAAVTALFTGARAKALRSHAAGIQAVFYQGGAGVGMSSGKQHNALRQLEQDARDKTAQIATEHAVQQGVWAREDIKAIIELELKQYKDQWDVVAGRLAAEEEILRSKIQEYSAHVESEGQRRGWTELEVKAILDAEGARINAAVQGADIQLRNLLQFKTALIQVKSAMAQAHLQLADTNLSFQGAQSINTRDE